MAAAILGEAVLGAVFGELLKAVVEASKTATQFRDVLAELKSTLSSIQPTINAIESLNIRYDREHETKPLMEIISRGEELVTQCVKIHRWNFSKKTCYTNKLRGLKEELKHFCEINMQTQQTRDIKEVLYNVEQLAGEVSRLRSKEVSDRENGTFSQVAVVGSCEPPKPRGEVVGLDVPLTELKMKLFKDGVSVIVVSAQGGSGKTTLVQELCRDEEVKGIISCA